ncbi:MAG: ATP phosphoribosyltransferase [Dehalococcoidia bacterium]
MSGEIRVALPRGELRDALAEQLRDVGFVPAGYGEGSRAYRFEVTGHPAVVVRVFSDRDIPIQVALGQYDLGITRSAWVDELLVRHAQDSIVPLRPLDLGRERLVVAAPAGTDLAALAASRVVRVATEYPHLTSRFLNRLRVPSYRLYEVWGQAQAWPPEDADVAVVPEQTLAGEDLVALATVHEGSPWLIANRASLATRDLASALDALLRLPMQPAPGGPVDPPPLPRTRAPRLTALDERQNFRIAVPDGHAQRHTFASLAEAGIAFEGYEERAAIRRPRSSLPGVEVKVIRPQDMPMAVALGAYDLALTGRDWLAAHLSAFPGSPVVELADLRRSRYSLGAVVPEDLPAETIEEAIAYWRREDPNRPIRVASEYVALADDYARERRLGRYQVIPIAGASEGFVPDDAEILIEGSETGTTLRANRLRMIDITMESTNCAIGALERPAGLRGEIRDQLVERLRAAAAALVVA